MSENEEYDFFSEDENTLFPEDEQVEIVNIDPVDQPKPFFASSVIRKIHITRRQFRLSLRLSLVVSLLLFSILLFPGSFSALQTLTQRLSGSNTASTTTNAEGFYLDAWVPWTHASLDGRQVTLPTIAPLRLSSGKHSFSWAAEPFLLQSCTISVPLHSTDTCRVASGQVVRPTRSTEPGLFRVTQAQIIQLPESLTTLSVMQRTALMHTIQAQLGQMTTTETVYPGEQYTTEQGITIAKQALKATLQFQINTTGDGDCFAYAYLLARNGLLCSIQQQECSQLCTAPWPWRYKYATLYPDASLTTWFPLTMIRPSWSYTTANGHTVIDHVNNAGYGIDEELALLAISWNDGWNVNVLTGSQLGPPMYTSAFEGESIDSPTSLVQVSTDPVCAPARYYVASGLTPSPQDGASRYADVRMISTTNLAFGCLIVANATTSATQGTTAVYIVRFGVLSTVSATAHLLRPELPRADSHIQSMATRLATLPGQEAMIKIGD